MDIPPSVWRNVDVYKISDDFCHCTGHSLSVGDIVVLNRDGKETAYEEFAMLEIEAAE